MRTVPVFVAPAKAGAFQRERRPYRPKIPACAGMTIWTRGPEPQAALAASVAFTSSAIAIRPFIGRISTSM